MRNFVSLIPSVLFLLFSGCGSESSKTESLASESATAFANQSVSGCSGSKKVKWTEADFSSICRRGFATWRDGNAASRGTDPLQKGPSASSDVTALTSSNEPSFDSNYGRFCTSLGLLKSGSAKERRERSKLMDSLEAKVKVDDRVAKDGDAAASKKIQLAALIGQLQSCPAQLFNLKIDEDEKACSTDASESAPCRRRTRSRPN